MTLVRTFLLVLAGALWAPLVGRCVRPLPGELGEHLVGHLKPRSPTRLEKSALPLHIWHPADGKRGRRKKNSRSFHYFRQSRYRFRGFQG